MELVDIGEPIGVRKLDKRAGVLQGDIDIHEPAASMCRNRTGVSGGDTKGDRETTEEAIIDDNILGIECFFMFSLLIVFFQNLDLYVGETSST